MHVWCPWDGRIHSHNETFSLFGLEFSLLVWILNEAHLVNTVVMLSAFWVSSSCGNRVAEAEGGAGLYPEAQAKDQTKNQDLGFADW